MKTDSPDQPSDHYIVGNPYKPTVFCSQGHVRPVRIFVFVAFVFGLASMMAIVPAAVRVNQEWQIVSTGTLWYVGSNDQPISNYTVIATSVAFSLAFFFNELRSMWAQEVQT